MEKNDTMKRKYETPKIEVVYFDKEDIITVSGDKAGHVNNGYYMPRLF